MTPNAILAVPTPEESRQTWTCTHPHWGTGLSLDGYIQRELDQADLPLARDGGLRPWVLVEADSSSSSSPDGDTGTRTLLSSCETLRKRALVRRPDGTVHEVLAHGVASVFTDPALRGKGHARTMLERLGERLEAEERARPGDATFSVLYSDIGKVFYDRLGWRPFASSHLAFPAAPAEDSATAQQPAEVVAAIRYDDIPQLAQADERLVRDRVARPPTEPGKTTRVAILPDLDALQWHILRDASQCDHVFGRKPARHGVVYTAASGARVWAIWRRNHAGAPSQPEKNTLYILRLVVEDEEGMPDDELARALEAIVAAARDEARDWACGAVHLWNPEPRVRSLVEGNPKLGAAKFVARENDSIASLRWFGDGSSTDEVEWLINEKYAWC